MIRTDVTQLVDRPQFVARLARERLGTSHHFLRHIHCDFEDGVATLRGRVPSYYLKQVAQSLVSTVDGVERVENEVEVAQS